MVTKAYSSTVYGVEAKLISIEVNVVNGTKFFIVGLPDSAIKESEHRIESVLKHINKYMPRQRVIVNLAPASLRKEGAAYDLPIALAILKSSFQEPLPELAEYMILGELALNGMLRPVKGALPVAMLAARQNFKGLIVPRHNAKEAAIVGGVPVLPVEDIQEAIAFLNNRKFITPVTVDTDALFHKPIDEYAVDMEEVKGQAMAKRSVEVAAAGGHNMLMVGPPGAGKTMLAKRIPSILPRLQLAEALETSKIYSVVGKLEADQALLTQRPFRAPHHTISDVALVGGGSMPQPGEISLAHNGVLFLDELPEFKRSTLEVLRQPSETNMITVSRAKLSVDFPANFMLIASMNPCPCGYYTHPERACICSPLLRKKYVSKIWGPLLDRIDIQIQMPPVTIAALANDTRETPSRVIQERVTQARNLQRNRFKGSHIHNNAMMPGKLVEKFCKLSPEASALLHLAMNKLELSGRAYDSIRKVSRTIADLAGSEHIAKEHVAEAVHYRSLDRAQWGT